VTGDVGDGGGPGGPGGPGGEADSSGSDGGAENQQDPEVVDEAEEEDEAASRTALKRGINESKKILQGRFLDACQNLLPIPAVLGLGWINVKSYDPARKVPHLQTQLMNFVIPANPTFQDLADRMKSLVTGYQFTILNWTLD
jgi:hypothetical protein